MYDYGLGGDKSKCYCYFHHIYLVYIVVIFSIYYAVSHLIQQYYLTDCILLYTCIMLNILNKYSVTCRLYLSKYD